MSVAQGELLFRKVETLPEGTSPMDAPDGAYIVGHSETGHHHVMDASTCEVVAGPARQNPEGMAIIYAIVKEPTEVRHLRGHDTHEPLRLAPGMYEIRPSREYHPSGWQRVID